MCSRGRVLKIVAVGDGAVGKTCLLVAYTQGSFNEEYVPTVFDNYAGQINVDGKEFNYTLWDTAGQEVYDRCRVLSYTQTNIFLVCFSLVNPVSFQNISKVWIPEIRKECGQKIPAILVGTKLDLRSLSAPAVTVTKAEGKKLARSLKMDGYVECSAKTNTGCEDVFQAAVKAAITPKPEGRCILL
ncbi:ras-related C3 botulinum toxin substrate 1-like [Homarus americanus]|uniref:ras-related C3 botulinum toxin substrate 1-like n=1 Tax=Homarus americanus TaxID=6706 RepID=UPI001C480A63|nr:ras-related C3 botulinum toxin substrate 1-like [Homarus americanus]